MTKDFRKRTDNDPTMPLMRYVSDSVARMLAKTPITPNQATIFNFIIFVPLILYFFILGTYRNNLIGLGLIFITVIIDFSDGALARIKSTYSTYGAWLDRSLDAVFQFSLFVAVIIGVYRVTSNSNWFIVGLCLLFGQNMANYIGLHYEKDFGFDAYEGSREFMKKFSEVKSISWLDSFLKNIIVPSNLFYILVFTARYLLIMGILLNRLDIFLIMFTVTINIRWLSMYLLYLRSLTDTASKLYTVNFLREMRR